MSRKFNHDFYDGLIFSGRINFLRLELQLQQQQQIQNIFCQIKTHNEYLDLVVLRMMKSHKKLTNIIWGQIQMK